MGHGSCGVMGLRPGRWVTWVTKDDPLSSVIGNVTVDIAHTGLHRHSRFTNYFWLVPFFRYNELLVESRHFFLPHMYLAPPEVTPLEFHKDLWRQKTRILGLSSDVACVMINLVVLIELRLERTGP